MRTTRSAASKRDISDILSDDAEGDIPTKKTKSSAGAGRRQKQRHSASPVTPPTGPRKRTNEQPGLIGKKSRRTKAEAMQERAMKAAEAKAIVAGKVNAMAQLAAMEVDQEDKESKRHQQVVRRKPSIVDHFVDHSGEEFDFENIDALDSEQSSESERESMPTPAGTTGVAAGSKKTKVSILCPP